MTRFNNIVLTLLFFVVQASIIIKNNTASLKGAAIDIDSLILCGWDVESKGINFTRSLKWKNFIYEGNRVCVDANSCQNSGVDISTDVANLVEVNGVKELKVCYKPVRSLHYYFNLDMRSIKYLLIWIDHNLVPRACVLCSNV